MIRALGIGLSFVAVAAQAQVAKELPPPVNTTVDFARDIRPILASRCFPCHGPQLQLHKLRLDRKAEASKGGESGVAAILPGKSADSLMIKYVAGLDPDVVMPPSGPRLTAAEIGLLRAWIDQGASYGEEPAAQTAAQPMAAPRRAVDYWAFKPPARLVIPSVKNAAWARNPIDAFVLAKLEAKGWKPSPPAAPQALLRRIYLDLIGLPPTLAEREEFLKDPSPTSIDRLVDNLLARPSYGERWARRWLDLVRYAETNGYERDATKPNAWRYRDYVIRSFNDDKPFDRLVLEQLAGDELAEITADSLTALGYYRLGPWDDEPADPQVDRFDQLDDIVSTTSQVFLGLTLGCARCHNHKFDPLLASDYYSMVAIFNGLERPRNGRTELDLPVGTRAELEALAARDRQIEPLEKQIKELRDAFRTEFLNSGRSKLAADVVRAFLTDPKKRDDNQRKLIADHAKELEQEIDEALPADIRKEIAAPEQRIAGLKEATPDLPRAYFLHEPSPHPPQTHLLIRGKAAQPGPEVQPGVPAVLVSYQPQFPPPSYTSQRRLTLARWITSPDHPLTARVLVNRIWQYHFGEGLVRTPSDFGMMGEEPTHPELLDWLASWFVDEGWSIKKLHRLIMTSNTYRMSKAWNSVYGAEDPEDRLLWRVPYTRLEVEAIRDSMLAVSGQLNPQMYGPSMYPFIPEAALAGNSDPDKIWKNSEEREASRRTIYAFLKRSMIVPMLEVLDLCDTTKTSGKRAVTSVAPQALTLFNGDFVNRQARHLASRLEREAGPDPEKQIERAYLLALSRPPTPAERKSMLEFLRTEPLHELCRVIFNLNELVYTD